VTVLLWKQKVGEIVLISCPDPHPSCDYVRDERIPYGYRSTGTTISLNTGLGVDLYEKRTSEASSDATL
jgi:hypothetical protein